MLKIKYLYRAWRYRFKIDSFEIAFIRSKLQKGSIAVDIGAHKGGYLYWMQQSVGKNGRVYAFEPQPILFEYLKKIKNAMSWHHVSVDNRAISSEVGSFDLYIPQHGGATSPGATLRGEKMDDGNTAFQTIKVTTETLDSFFSKTDKLPDFLKIDVEGNELSVFEGATRILQEKKPIILFECEQRHLGKINITTVFSFLEKYDYQGFFIKNNALYPISEFVLNEHQKQGEGRFWAVKSYCNNFIFM